MTKLKECFCVYGRFRRHATVEGVGRKTFIILENSMDAFCFCSMRRKEMNRGCCIMLHHSSMASKIAVEFKVFPTNLPKVAVKMLHCSRVKLQCKPV